MYRLLGTRRLTIAQETSSLTLRRHHHHRHNHHHNQNHRHNHNQNHDMNHHHQIKVDQLTDISIIVEQSGFSA